MLAWLMVRVAGVEPALLAEPDFESGASTNSTTPATWSSGAFSIIMRVAQSRLVMQVWLGYRRGTVPG